MDCQINSVFQPNEKQRQDLSLGNNPTNIQKCEVSKTFTTEHKISRCPNYKYYHFQLTKYTTESNVVTD